MARIGTSSTGGNVAISQGGNTATVNGDGSLNVRLSGTESGPTTLVYNEVSSVPLATETTIVSYTVTGTAAQLLAISASGQNIGEIRIYKNADVIDKQYLTWTAFNLDFNFRNIDFATGDVVSVKGINDGQDLCSFNAKIQIIEET